MDSTLLIILVFGFLMSLIAVVGGLFVFLPEAVLKRCLKPMVAFAAGSLLGGALLLHRKRRSCSRGETSRTAPRDLDPVRVLCVGSHPAVSGDPLIRPAPGAGFDREKIAVLPPIASRDSATNGEQRGTPSQSSPPVLGVRASIRIQLATLSSILAPVVQGGFRDPFLGRHFPDRSVMRRAKLGQHRLSAFVRLFHCQLQSDPCSRPF